MKRDEGGQAIALFAVSLPLFLVLLLLVIDGGRLLVERERIRNAAQFAAEAVASLAGDPSGQAPTAAQAGTMASAALSRNLPGERYASAVNLTPPTQGAPFKASVRVEKIFVSSIQRITFTIGATAAAQLGASAASGTSGVGPTTPYTPGCFSAGVNVSAWGSGARVGSPSVVDASSGGQPRGNAYVRPGASVLWYVPVTITDYVQEPGERGGSVVVPRVRTQTLTGTFTVPAGPTIGAWYDPNRVTNSVSGLTIQVQGAAAFGQFAQCPR